MSNDASQPLLPSDQVILSKETFKSFTHFLNPARRHVEGNRRVVRRALTSKWGHYFVLGLVSLDVSGIIADFVLRLFECERPNSEKGWGEALKVLGTISLVFSCLFMAELIASVWAFGFDYFRSKFHCFDATIIVAAFVVDVLLKDVLEEVGSLVVILRLWRVFKIIEELSAGAEEHTGELEQSIEDLEKDKKHLLQRVQDLEAART